MTLHLRCEVCVSLQINVSHLIDVFKPPSGEVVRVRGKNLHKLSPEMKSLTFYQLHKMH